ncbi:MAG: FHA domain-containing protein [bacterium]
MTAVKLKVLQETQPAKTQEFLYHQDIVTIGRVSSNLLQLPDPQKKLVSRNHARIERIAEAFHLIDLGSTNGTYLNDKKLEADQPYELHPGDQIKIGEYLIQFFALTMPEPEEPELPTLNTNPFLNESNEFARALVSIGKKFLACAENSQRLKNLQDALAEPLRQLAASEIGAVLKTVLAGLNGAAVGSDNHQKESPPEELDAKLLETQNVIQAMREEAQQLQDENRQLRDLIDAMESQAPDASPAAPTNQEEFAAKLHAAQATIQALREENRGLQALINADGSPLPSPAPALVSAPEPATARLYQVLDLLLEAVVKMIAGSSKFESEFIGTTINHPPDFAKIYKSSSQELKKHLLNESVSAQEKTELINALKQILDRVIAHQMALLDGYHKCVNEVPQNLLQLLDPKKLSKELEDRQVKIPIFSEKKFWQAYCAKHNELMKEDRRFFGEKIFRPAFMKGYHERMDSVRVEITDVKKL